MELAHKIAIIVACVTGGSAVVAALINVLGKRWAEREPPAPQPERLDDLKTEVGRLRDDLRGLEDHVSQCRVDVARVEASLGLFTRGRIPDRDGGASPGGGGPSDA